MYTYITQRQERSKRKSYLHSTICDQIINSIAYVFACILYIQCEISSECQCFTVLAHTLWFFFLTVIAAIQMVLKRIKYKMEVHALRLRHENYKYRKHTYMHLIWILFSVDIHKEFGMVITAVAKMINGTTRRRSRKLLEIDLFHFYL